MTFLTDGTAVKFTGIDHTFNVYSTFVEFNIGSSVFSIKFYGLIIAFGFFARGAFRRQNGLQVEDGFKQNA